MDCYHFLVVSLFHRETINQLKANSKETLKQDFLSLGNKGYIGDNVSMETTNKNDNKNDGRDDVQEVCKKASKKAFPSLERQIPLDSFADLNKLN